MINGINQQEKSVSKKDVIKKAYMAATQQAHRGRDINEVKLLTTAAKFGKFAEVYCETYRKIHNRQMQSHQSNKGNNLIRQAKHCAKKQFEVSIKDNHPNLEHVFKCAKHHGENQLFYTVCFAQHYNSILQRNNLPIVEAFIMPPFKRGNASISSQVTTQSNAIPTTDVEAHIDLRNSLSDSREEQLVHILNDLKNPNDYIPDMIIMVQPQPKVIFSSTTTISNDKQANMAYDNSKDINDIHLSNTASQAKL